ncbi:MAG: long-chain fatty acid--CoA ligase [SAR202 cluster bacterium]|jgi:long-subunit acyl-CoA synthetase (AMP-forming)|nr:long-chain fatty acid--CoA ligase [SAR202 cluster bacterium]MQG53497.1 long-chain fatty acid--CoA ligase [SAR202 cluster bacterium]|tara:strand:- start:32899 stop:33027 length:129 start_codon:yes stop_codon:yes gene_type:complete
MKEYWNQLEAKAEAMRNGWMHAGDAGTLDDEGYCLPKTASKI